MERTLRLLVFASCLFAVPAASASSRPNSPWEMTEAMERWMAEGNAARFPAGGIRKIFFYCNRDGLFSLDLSRV